jgi:HTH-type transcriptional regulator/antitoxin HigA
VQIAMSTNIKQLTPAFATHPGEILKDELDARDIKQKDFAELIGIQPTHLNEIIKGKRGLNTELSILIGTALKMDAEIWQNLQSKYELDLVKINKKTQERLQAIDQWHMIEPYIPVKFFKKQNVIQGDPTKDIDIIKSIYRVNSFEQIAALYSKPYYARFRKSEKLSEDKINIVGWVKLVEYLATQEIVNEFNVRKIDDLTLALKEIVRENKNTVTQCTTLLKNYGIKLIINENPSKCPVDGVSFWSEGKPAIGMTLRHNRIDNFAFTLFHELGHICQHLINDNTAEFIDVDLDICSKDGEYKEEREADTFAQNNLIDPKSWEDFFSSYSRLQEDAIIKFAQEQKIHPAVVKGRICHELKYYKFKTEKISSELS